MKKIRRQIILAIAMVFLVLAVCSAAAAAEVSGNGTMVQAQDQTAANHNSTDTGSTQTNIIKRQQENCNSTNSSSVNTNTNKQPSKVVISGQVKKCSSGKPFAGATVTAEKDGKKLASTTTKEDGTYTLEFQCDGGIFDVTASYLGHESSSKKITVSPDSNGNLQGSADFQLGMDNVYVSPTGSDTTGDGTQAHPYQTIGKGIEEVNAGGTVHLADGTYQGLGNRGLTINKDVTIAGQSQTGTVIDAQGADRIFTINPGFTVTLQNLTLANGKAGNGGAIFNEGDLTVNDCIFLDNTATSLNWGEGGGAIYNSGGNLTVTGSTFTGNSATYNGGAINNNFSGTLTVTDCTFTGNTASPGGAIYNDGTLAVENCTFNGNSAFQGGAIHNNFDRASTVTDCTFTDNSATYGGAIHNWGILTVINCTFANNNAYAGGAIFSNVGALNVDTSSFTSNTADFGGAIENFGGDLTVTDSTFFGNSATYNGGAIENYDTLTVNDCTFTDNSATYGGAILNYFGTLAVDNSSFTDNAADYGGAIYSYIGTSNVNDSTFDSNSAIWGGAIYNDLDSTLTVDNSSFTDNTASEYGGAIINFGPSTVTGSNFENNAANLLGGAICNIGGDSTNRKFNFNRIIGNSPGNSEIYSEDGTVDATLNWWGSNTSPAGKISTGEDGIVLYDSWLILTVTADPTTINNGGTSTVTADLLHDSNGVYHDPALGHVPDGIPITLTTPWGSFNSDSITLNTVNGSVTATFHADGGTAPSTPVRITAAADGYTTNDAESAYITVLNVETPIVVNITIGENSSILSPHQSQTSNNSNDQAQTQTSINTNTNNLTNNNVNTASSTSSAANINGVFNSNSFSPILALINSNYAGKISVSSANKNIQSQIAKKSARKAVKRYKRHRKR